MLNLGRLAMQDLPSKVYDARVCGVEALQSHADAQDGDLACEVLDRIDGDTAVLEWVAWAGRDDEAGRLKGNELFEGELVVAVDV